MAMDANQNKSNAPVMGEHRCVIKLASFVTKLPDS